MLYLSNALRTSSASFSSSSATKIFFGSTMTWPCRLPKLWGLRLAIVSGLHLRRPERLLQQWKREIECGAAPDLALGPYAAPVTQDDALHVCQADSRALEVLGAVQALENSEEFARVPHVESYAVVAHETDRLAFARAPAADLDLGRATGARKFDRVREQVDDHRAQHLAIALDHGQFANAPDDLAPFDIGLQFLQRLFRQLFEVDRLAAHLHSPKPREDQQAVNQTAHVVGRLDDAPQVIFPGLVERSGRMLPQQIGEAGDVAQRRAQVVRDRVGEGLQLLVAGLDFRRSARDAIFQFFVQPS